MPFGNSYQNVFIASHSH